MTKLRKEMWLCLTTFKGKILHIMPVVRPENQFGYNNQDQFSDGREIEIHHLQLPRKHWKIMASLNCLTPSLKM